MTGVTVWQIPLADADASHTGALREVLALHTGQPAGRLRLVRGPYGKPALAGSQLAFNLSRRGNLVLVAVADAGQVGIDLERLGPLPEMAQIVAMLHADEQRFLHGLPTMLRQRAFFQIWARKEAVVKAIGTGLSTDLHSFRVVQPAPYRGYAATCQLDGLTLTLTPLATPAGTVATLATTAAQPDVWMRKLEAAMTPDPSRRHHPAPARGRYPT